MNNSNANSSNLNGSNLINSNANSSNLNETLDNAPQQNTSPIADDSSSNIQQPINKNGWCYIGDDKGYRSCIEVGDNDLCMSGNIFPTQEICVNPSLRY